MNQNHIKMTLSLIFIAITSISTTVFGVDLDNIKNVGEFEKTVSQNYDCESDGFNYIKCIITIDNANMIKENVIFPVKSNKIDMSTYNVTKNTIQSLIKKSLENNTNEKIMDKLDKIYSKVETLENNTKNQKIKSTLTIIKLVITQQAAQLLPQLLEYLPENNGSNKGISKINPSFTEGTITDENIQQILTGKIFTGNENSNILLLEYSDLQCPFCKNLHNEGTIKNIIIKNNIKYYFMDFPLDFHEYAMISAKSLECTGKTGGKDQYFQFIDKIFSKDELSTNIINSTLSGLNINKADFKACLKDANTKTFIDNEINLGKTNFNIQGTPGSIIINKNTKKWILIPGAYPSDEFQKAIDYISGN